jgi:hypothetical protein
VLVRASYFPNWKVSGAQGPYRVAPNFMVVVPTSNDVKLTYGLTKYEWLGRLGTLLGIVGVGLLIAWKGAERYGAIVRRDDDSPESGEDDDGDGPGDGDPDNRDDAVPGHASDEDRASDELEPHETAVDTT